MELHCDAMPAPPPCSGRAALPFILTVSLLWAATALGLFVKQRRAQLWIRPGYVRRAVVSHHREWRHRALVSAHARVRLAASSLAFRVHATLCSWVDVDTRGYVAPIAGYSALPNTVYYRIPRTPQAADVVRIQSDVNSTFPTDPLFSCAGGREPLVRATSHHSSTGTLLHCE